MKTMTEEGEPPIFWPQPAMSRSSRAHRSAAAPKQSLQIKTILVPLDFSRASMQALKYTLRLAGEFKAVIHLVHVQPADELTAISRAGHLMLTCADAIALMQDRLAELKEKHDVQFWPDNCHVVSGKPFEEICKLAHEIQAALIVLPTRGHSGLKRIALGSTAERVARYSPCPVFIPRGKKYKATAWNGEASVKFSVRKILVPVDFSQCSIAGVNYAARLARRFDAKLRLFHAIFPYANLFGMDRVDSNLTMTIENARNHAQEEMKKLRHLRFMDGVSSETEIRSGSTVDEICAESRRPDIDVMVTSTHGRTGFKRALIGSVAEHVLRYAECPVIIVPSRGRF
jgi:nucleotide-binding universal stress UspA family protein